MIWDRRILWVKCSGREEVQTFCRLSCGLTCKIWCGYSGLVRLEDHEADEACDDHSRQPRKNTRILPQEE